MKKPDEQQNQLRALAAQTGEPDTSDVRELPPELWAKAEIGKFYRPRKEPVSLRLDTDVLDWFRRGSSGKGYQTAINAALRQHIQNAGK